MPIPEEEEPIEPIMIRDEPRLASSKSASRAKGSESIVVWGAVALIGLAVALYLIVNPPKPKPVPEESAQVVTAPEPEARTPSSRRQTRTRPPAIGIGKTDPPQPVAAAKTRVEPERKAVDPREGFETGEAFDNPPSPGRYGARSSGLLERPTPAPRPNMPDPSFGRNPQ